MHVVYLPKMCKYCRVIIVGFFPPNMNLFIHWNEKVTTRPFCSLSTSY